MNKKNILLLTLVHPDFLPPVYAVAQVLRDLGYNIIILTFDSFVPAKLDLGDNIMLESVGKHYDSGMLQRLKLRAKFTKRAKKLADENTTSIISFCPFSFHCGLEIKNKIPLIYIALETADFILSQFLRSPLSNFRNLRTFQQINKADLVATPSIQRSAWLAGRCHLSFMPYTILNTSYLPSKTDENRFELFKELVPAAFLDKKIILYTGAVNTDTCIKELVEAFDLANDERCVMIINGLKDNDYCNELREMILKSQSVKRIQVLPYLTRDKVMALQANAHIGVNLTREFQDNVKSKMVAPNKVGEYLLKNLYILGIMNEYLRPLSMKGIASLANSASPEDICVAIKDAVNIISDNDHKMTISSFVKDYYCMQQQLQPVIKYIDNIGERN